MDFIEAISDAALGQLTTKGIDVFLSAFNKKAKNENSINPRPKFHYFERDTNKKKEVYIQVEDLSNNWLDVMISVKSTSSEFYPSSEGFTSIPMVAPMTTGEPFLIGVYDPSHETSNNSQIVIESLFKSDDKKEKGRGYVVFEGTDQDFIHILNNTETDLKNIVLEVGKISKTIKYSLEETLNSMIAEKLREADSVKYPDYEESLKIWRESVLSEPNAELRFNYELASNSFTKISVINRSMKKTYRNLTLKIHMSKELNFIDENFEFELLDWEIPEPVEPDVYSPTLLFMGGLNQQFKSSTHSVPDLTSFSNFDYPKMTLRGDPSISIYNQTDNCFEIDIPEIKANESINLTVDNSDYLLALVEPTNDLVIDCQIELREESFGFLKKELKLSIDQ